MRYAINYEVVFHPQISLTLLLPAWIWENSLNLKAICHKKNHKYKLRNLKNLNNQ